MSKPDDYKNGKFDYNEDSTFQDPPNSVDATTQAMIADMKAYRDQLFAASNLQKDEWYSVIRIVPPHNNKDANKSNTYKPIQQIDNMQFPDVDHCRSHAQKIKRDLQKHLKDLFAAQTPAWDPKTVVHTIRVAKRDQPNGNGQDDNSCGCGCSAKNGPYP
jgi:hypothetical protein